MVQLAVRVNAAPEAEGVFAVELAAFDVEGDEEVTADPAKQPTHHGVNLWSRHVRAPAR